MVDRSRRFALPVIEPRTQTGAIWPPLPPPVETEAERIARLEEAARKQKVSDKIDQEIELEKLERQRKPKPNTTILLLGKHPSHDTLWACEELKGTFKGQAESGKSTILKVSDPCLFVSHAILYPLHPLIHCDTLCHEITRIFNLCTHLRPFTRRRRHGRRLSISTSCGP